MTYKLPTPDLLETLSDALRKHKFSPKKIEKELAKHDIHGFVNNSFYLGPFIMTCDFVFDISKHISKDINHILMCINSALSLDDFGMVRVVPTAETNQIKIEIPTCSGSPVSLMSLIKKEEFQKSSHKIPIVMGVDTIGAAVYKDLTEIKYLLIYGDRGTGKTMFLQTVIMSILYKLPPNDCKLLLLSPAGIELTFWENIPHLINKTVTDPAVAIDALKYMVAEMDQRYKKLSMAGVKSKDEYTGSDMPYMVIIIDELAELIYNNRQITEWCVQQLVKCGHFVGIYLVMTTAYSKADVITEIINENIPNRISFKVRNKSENLIALDQFGSENLLFYGDILYSFARSASVRIHTPLVDTKMIYNVDNFFAENSKSNPSPEFLSKPLPTIDPKLYDMAVECIIKDKRPTISYIQRKLNLGYNMASEIMDQMVKNGIVSDEEPNSGKYTLL